MTLENISTLQPTEAVEALDLYIAVHPDEEEAYTLRGLRHWALGHRAKAINDYLKAISINPQSRAVQALANANAILDFYNKNLYNP
ncbi:MAG: tetratricopeptide repeat protein [Muribaculaceae bacterium]|nr:tetratricopeptide repeat protein [Muribaculaceae bacterium]